MIEKKYITILLLFIVLNAFSQEEKEDKQKKTFATGVYFDRFPFYNNIMKNWQVQIAPYGGYYITQKLLAGAACKYSFNSFEHKSIHRYGGGIFARYTFIEDLGKYIRILPVGFFVQGEYEIEKRSEKLKTDTAGYLAGPNPAHLWWVGGGLTQSLTKRMNLNFLLLWNIHEYEGAPTNPVARMDIIFNF